MPDESIDKLLRIEEHQMFLERQVEQLSGEVLELSRLLRLTQMELKKIQAALTPLQQDDSAPQGPSDQQAGS